MKIKVSRNSGFCFGVNRAVNAVFEVIKAGNKCCTLGPIVHNTNIVNLYNSYNRKNNIVQ